MQFAFAVGNAGFARRCIFVSCMQWVHDHRHLCVLCVLLTFRLGFILVGQAVLVAGGESPCCAFGDSGFLRFGVCFPILISSRIAGVFCHVRIMCVDVRSVGMRRRVLLGSADVGQSLGFCHRGCCHFR